MNRTMLLAAIALASLAGAYVGAVTTSRAPVEPAVIEEPVGATLIPGLGDYAFPITTRSPEAQRWFNQALMLTFGFNHDAAERSYLKAAEIDPDCAMCWWGASLVLGPHVNAAMNPDHAGALHLYVHAVEASAQPERGVAAADRLRTLIPGSGHLVHMPAHICARVGRWHDAVIANQVAIEADRKYLSMCRGNCKGVYPLG